MLRSWRNSTFAAAAGTLACGLLCMAGCDASILTLSATPAGTGTSSAASSSPGTGPSPTATSLSFPDMGGTIAEIPAAYVRGVPNRWVLFLHGYNQDANTIHDGSYGDVEAALLHAGYVVIAMTNTTRNCYGNAQCNADVAAVAKLGKRELSLQPEPFVVADSMGGFTVLNAISSGALHPKAVVGWCLNTDLAWDYISGGARTPITADYSISAANPYAVATAGFDPMLQGGAVYAGTPFQLWSSDADTVVGKTANTDRFAAMVNASGGSAVVNASTGDHLDPSNFDPAAVVAFFNAH